MWFVLVLICGHPSFCFDEVCSVVEILLERNSDRVEKVAHFASLGGLISTFLQDKCVNDAMGSLDFFYGVILVFTD